MLNIILFYLQLRAQVPVLKKAVLDEQGKEESLRVCNGRQKKGVVFKLRDILFNGNIYSFLCLFLPILY